MRLKVNFHFSYGRICQGIRDSSSYWNVYCTYFGQVIRIIVDVSKGLTKHDADMIKEAMHKVEEALFHDLKNKIEIILHWLIDNYSTEKANYRWR